MPPAAIASSVFRTGSSSPRRSRNSSTDDGVHVDRVQIGPLLPVDLHVHEALVHQLGGRLVLERLVLHHVAPVAGGVPDREQDRPVLRAGALERLVAPRVPVDRVVGVLEEVRARLVRQAVHSACSSWRPTSNVQSSTTFPSGSSTYTALLASYERKVSSCGS